MSQTSTLAQGEDELDDTAEQPSPESEAANDSWTNVLSAAFAEDLAATDDDTPADLPEVEGLAPADEGTDDTPEDGTATATVPEPTSPEAQLQERVAAITANPKSINEIPAKFHPAILEAYAAQEREVQLRAAKLALEQGLKQGREQALAEIKAQQDAESITDTVKQIDQFKSESPAEYVEWRDLNPEIATAYDRFKREGPPDPRQVQAQQAQVAQSGQAMQSQLMQLLQGHPDADARIRAKHAQQPYGYTPQEVARLAADIAEEKATDLVKAKTPVIAAAEKRQAAATNRATTPKPNVATGGGKEVAVAGDYKSLIAAGFRESR